MKIGYLTKRRDACHWLRILNPMSYLNQRGHECTDEVFERQAFCSECHKNQRPYGPYEVQYDQMELDTQCPYCGTIMISAHEFKEWNESIDQLIEEKDLICFQRPTDLSHIKLIRRAKRMGKKTIQICDDHYLDIPDWNTGAKYYRDRKGNIQQSLIDVDGLDVTVPYLKKIYESYNKNISVIPNSLDMDLIEVTPELPDFKAYNKKGHLLTPEQFAEMRSGKKFFLWSGSPTHEKDMELIISAMRRLVRSENVCLGLMGYVHRGFIEVVPENQLFLFSLVPCSQYFMTYKGMKADFGLAPVVECEFNRGKSPLKALEYMSIGIMPIMSDFETYQGCSPQGFYAKNDEYSWFKTMRDAIHCDNHSERVEANRKFVDEHYNVKKNITLWENFYHSVLNS